MNQKMRKQLKRIIPVTLAVIVLAGFIFGAIGMMAAYAADETEADKKPDEQKWISTTQSTLILIDPADPEYEGDIDVSYNKKYNARLSIKLTSAEGKPAFEDFKNKGNDPKEFIEKVSIKTGSGENFKTSGATEFQLISPPEGESEVFLFELKDVIPQYKENSMSIIVSFANELDDFSFSKRAKNATFVGNYPNKPIGSINIDSNKVIEDDSDDTTTSRSGTTSSEDEASIPTPKMIISSFDIPSEVAYGEEFDATIEFYNNSAYKDMVNVTMTVTPSEGVIIRNGVNQRHYIKVPKRQSTTERFRFKASDKLATESITLTVKFEYEYRFNSEYKQGSHEEVLSLVAKPKPEESSSSEEDKTGTEGSISSFELLSIVVPDKVYPDEDAYITIRAINKDHQFDASNVQVTVTGDGLLNSGNTVYHGALAHSTQAEIETTLQFASPGTYPLVCTLVYEDSVGLDEDKKPIVRINDIQKDFTVTVLESPYADMGNMGDMGDMGDMGMDPGMDGAVPAQGGAVEWMRGHLWAPIGGGIVLLAVVVGVVRRIRRKKAADDDDL